MLICTDKNVKLKDGALANVAPTVLDYIKVAQPKEMDQDSLLVK
ncbi:phosphoglycerate mutase [Mycoplasmopsis edwardii]|uniref:Phosphoglycerate mutase n=3 Tax=Mycoplasmopsis edwardii TaxID=53558 RepID=A0A3B0QAA8_9BACT|nr:phosphoglycerate mutase [Mycoplasmopsis edwardii]